MQEPNAHAHLFICIGTYVSMLACDYSCLYITTYLCKNKYIYISMCRVLEMQSDRVLQGDGMGGVLVLCNLTRNGHGYPFNGHEYINNKNVFVYYTQT